MQRSGRGPHWAARVLFAIGAVACLGIGQVLAEGCEDLGDVVSLGDGNAFVEAGVGTQDMTGGSFSLEIPLDATVNQVFAYWGGEATGDDPGDNEITINGVDVIGTPLCPDGPVYFFGNVSYQAFRAELDLEQIPIGGGSNPIVVEGMGGFGFANSGVGLVAVIDDGSASASLALRDGVDLAFIGFAPPRFTTEEQVFTFDSASFDRTGKLLLIDGSNGEGRPNAVRVVPGTGGEQIFNDVFGQPVSAGGDGPLWSSTIVDVSIPAGANMITVQALSINNPGGFDDLEASLAWLVGGLAVPDSICGDGIVDSDLGETCDPPGSAQTNDNLCRDDCTYCGDGVVDPGEECDPGSDPDCTLDCTVPPRCGDEIVDADLGETCDPPGSILPEDNVCRDDCTYCGDGVLDPEEECDFNAPDASPFCTTSCMLELPLGCRFTGGGVDTDGNWDHTLEDGSMIRNGAGNLPEGIDRYQFGGQAGARSALPPQPWGEWTHHQQRGPSGRFTFHGGTASAPAGTEIVEIRCSDPESCRPARPAPAKQLDFDGIGTFKSIGNGSNAPTWMIGDANVTAEGNGNQDFDGTYHWFEVNIDDLGEPGRFNAGAPDSDICPSIGFGEKGAVELGNCDCPDFYRITIYDGVDGETLATSGPNKTDVIYEVYGYIDGGNLQIHPLTGYDGN